MRLLEECPARTGGQGSTGIAPGSPPGSAPGSPRAGWCRGALGAGAPCSEPQGKKPERGRRAVPPALGTAGPAWTRHCRHCGHCGHWSPGSCCCSCCCFCPRGQAGGFWGVQPAAPRLGAHLGRLPSLSAWLPTRRSPPSRSALRGALPCPWGLSHPLWAPPPPPKPPSHRKQPPPSRCQTNLESLLSQSMGGVG